MTIRELEKSYSGREGDGIEHAFSPWRRYLARMLDISIYSILWSIVLAEVFSVNLLNESNLESLVNSFIAIIIMIFVEPLLLHVYGTTIGKAVFGIKILTSEGKKLSYKEGLERTWGVVANGMGYNIPIYTLVRLWKSYGLCKENRIQPWEDDINYTIKDTKIYRMVMCFAVYIGLITIFWIVAQAQYLPPNRGELTIEEFAENYNYYVDFFDINLGDEYLDETGKWKKKRSDGTIYVSLGHSEKPEYLYTIEDGYVKGISFEVEIKNTDKWVRSYDDDMMLISLAYISAQDEVGIFSKEQQQTIKEISNNTFNNFSFSEAGVELRCDIEWSGYTGPGANMLFPEEDNQENYFNIEFLMSKTKY